MKDEYDLSNAKRGAVVPPPEDHTRVNMWVDNDVLAWFREQVNNAGGGDWQADMNDVLRQYIAYRKSANFMPFITLFLTQTEETVEDRFRRILREELQPVAKR